MKKMLAVLLAVLLVSACAYADTVPGISNSLFSDAKEALSLLSYGEFAEVSELLQFAGSAPTESEWENFAKNFSTLNGGTVQRDVSVAYWTGGAWCLAVPVSEPSSDSVEALVLTTDDGTSFSGYKYSNWGSVRSGYEGSDYVVWNREYVAGTPVVIGD